MGDLAPIHGDRLPDGHWWACNMPAELPVTDLERTHFELRCEPCRLKLQAAVAAVKASRVGFVEGDTTDAPTGAVAWVDPATALQRLRVGDEPW